VKEARNMVFVRKINLFELKAKKYFLQKWTGENFLYQHAKQNPTPESASRKMTKSITAGVHKRRGLNMR
jgi:hypothetical protein